MHGHASSHGDGDDPVRIGLLHSVELAVGQAYEYYIPLVLEPLPVVSSPSVNQQAYLPESGAEREGGSVR